MKAQEWATRQKDAAGELAAIAKAKEVLEAGVKVFLQVSTKAKAHATDASDDKRARIMAVLAKLEESDKSYFFMQVKSEAQEGPFDKVKGLIESMIMRLEKQAELTATSDKSQVRIEKATATIAELKEQIKT